MTESEIRGIVRECVRNYHGSLLTEDRVGKNMKKARNVVKQYQPNADAMGVITAIRQSIPNSRINQCEYLPGVTRMYMDGEIQNGETISKLNSTLKLLGTGHANEYDNDLNGMSADELIKRFAKEVQDDFDTDVKAHNSRQFTENKSYRIYRIESAQEASKFGAYTDWCITSTEPGQNDDEYDDENPEMTLGYEMYKNYTNDGLGLFYFCIRNDYKTVPREEGEGCPLDNYGLSMIATSVDEDGKCNTITCRWNHDNGANDNVMTPMQLSEIIGRNYYDVFKPYTREELYAKGKIPFGDVEMLLKQGKDPEGIFTEMNQYSNGLYRVLLHDKYNYFNPKTKSLLSKDWFETATNFNDGFAAVSLEYAKSNYIKEDGTYLFDNWLNATAYPFKNGYASYYIHRKGTFIIDTNGNIINKVPISNIRATVIGGHIYAQGGMPKLLDMDGNTIVEGGITNVIDCGDNYLKFTIKELPSNISDRYFANTKYGLVTPDNKLFMNKYFDAIDRIKTGIIVGFDGGKGFICGKDGKLIGGTLFDSIDNIISTTKIVRVTLDGKTNYLDIYNDKYIFKNWPEYGTSYEDGYFNVKLSGKWYAIGPDFKPVIDMYFDDIRPLLGVYSDLLYPAIVEKNGKYTVLIKSGKLCDMWFTDISKVYNKTIGYLGGRNYLITPKADSIEVKPYTDNDRRQDNIEYDRYRREMRYN